MMRSRVRIPLEALRSNLGIVGSNPIVDDFFLFPNFLQELGKHRVFLSISLSLSHSLSPALSFSLFLSFLTIHNFRI